MIDAEKLILDRFDDFVETNDLDPYQIIYLLLQRAIWRITKTNYSFHLENEYTTKPYTLDGFYCEIDRELIRFSDYIEDGFFENIIRSEAGLSLTIKDLFGKSGPDYNKIREEGLKKEASRKKNIEDRKKQEIQNSILKLKDSGYTKEEILEMLEK